MANDIVQTIAEARVDARSLSEFVFKPAGFKVARRLAPNIDTLQFYIDRFNSLNGDFSSSVSVALSSLNSSVADAEGKVAYIETTVQDAINNTAVEGGVLADTFVVATESGRNQREVNRKTVFEYDTVADMLADVTIVSGKVVSTNGYHAKQDGGGAKYNISNTATDYSIPLANGLHAVFNDSFDIRKFGIRDNSTLDQTTEITRMVKYADSRVYEIDFLGFSLMTPKMWTWVASRGVLEGTTTPFVSGDSQVMGMGFNYPHKLKRLNITHDKTVRLETSHCQIVFAPLYKPAEETWFDLEDVTFDAWVDNYQPKSENYLGTYDGMRHGLFCHPAKDSEIPQWGAEVSNISFRFTNIGFTSPAYSYNLTTSAIYANRIEVDGLYGKFLGLYLNYHAKTLETRNTHGVQLRDLVESDRALVGNLIHYEAELSNKPPTDFEGVNIKDASCFRKVGEDYVLSTVYAFKNIGITSLKGMTLDNVQGQVRIEETRLDFANIKNCDKSLCFLPRLLTHPIEVVVVNSVIEPLVGTYGSLGFMFSTSSFKSINISNSTIKRGLGASGSSFNVSVPILTLTDVTLEDCDYGIARGANYKIADLKITNMTIKDKSCIAYCDLTDVNINGLLIKRTPANTLSDVIFNMNTTPENSSLVITNMVSERVENAAYSFLAQNFGTFTFANSLLRVSKSSSNITHYIETNVIPKKTSVKTYDFPELAAGATQSVLVSWIGAKTGESFDVTFDKPLLGTRLWVDSEGGNTVTVYHQNPTAAAVNLSSGNLTVQKK